MFVILLLLAAGAGLVVADRRRRSDAPPRIPRPANSGPYADVASPVRWPTAWALARVEARRLIRHPAFIVGLILTPLALWAATGNESENVWWRAQFGLAVAFAPLGWLTIIATNLATLRSRRHGTDELFETLPTRVGTRTTGHVLSSLATIPVATVMVVAWIACLESALQDVYGTPDPAALAVAVLLVTGGAVAGVLAARILPWTVSGVAAVIVVIVVQANIGDAERSAERFLAFVVGAPSAGDPTLAVAHDGWHLVYLVALTVMAGALAVARSGVRRGIASVLAASILVAGMAGWMQTRPLSAEETRRLVAYLESPADHQTCTTSGSVTACAYPAVSGWVDDWHEVAQAVLAAAPTAVSDRPLTLRQRPHPTIGNSDCSPTPFLSVVPQPVERAADPDQIWRADGDVHPGFKWPEQFACGGWQDAGFFLGTQLGLWAVGLPPAPGYPYAQCRADGQARTLVALWLGTQASPGAPTALDRLTAEARGRSGWESHLDLVAWGWDEPPAWGVQFATGDLAAASAIAELPARQVTETLSAGWDQYADPATPGSTLLADLGLTGARPAPLADADGPCAVRGS